MPSVRGCECGMGKALKPYRHVDTEQLVYAQKIYSHLKYIISKDGWASHHIPLDPAFELTTVPPSFYERYREAQPEIEHKGARYPHAHFSCMNIFTFTL